MYVKHGKEGRWSHVLSDAYAPENLTWNLKMDPLEEEIPFLEVIIFRFDVRFRRCIDFVWNSAQPKFQVRSNCQASNCRDPDSGGPSRKKNQKKKTTASTPWFLCVFWVAHFFFRILGFIKAQGRKTWLLICQNFDEIQMSNSPCFVIVFWWFPENSGWETILSYWGW